MTNKQLASNRDTYWDSIKAVLIFLVVLGHAVQSLQYNNENFWDDALFKGIYLFHMPLFMLISGYFAAKSTAKRGKRVIGTYLLRLVTPCIAVALFTFTTELIREQSVAAACKGCSTLWFLVVLFECLVFYFILQWKRSWWYQGAMAIIPIIAALAVSEIPYLCKLWRYSHQFTFLWPVFLIGAFLNDTSFSHRLINKKWCIFLILYAFFFYIFEPEWYVYQTPLTFSIDTLIIDIIRTLAAISGCGTIMLIIKYLHPYISKIPIIQKTGRATLALYALQTYFFNFNYSNILTVSIGHIEVIIISITILAVLLLIYTLTRKNRPIAIFFYGEWNKQN